MFAAGWQYQPVNAVLARETNDVSATGVVRADDAQREAPVREFGLGEKLRT